MAITMSSSGMRVTVVIIVVIRVRVVIRISVVARVCILGIIVMVDSTTALVPAAMVVLGLVGIVVGVIFCVGVVIWIDGYIIAGAGEAGH